MRFELFGPVKAYVGDQEVGSLPPRQRLLLAALLLANGERVGKAELFEWLWDGEFPPDPGEQLHHRAYELRRTLAAAEPGEDPVPVDSGGYRIRMEGQQVDVHRFRELVDDARTHANGDDAEAVRLWREALGLWNSRSLKLRGTEPLAGLRGRQAQHARDTLQTEHREALIDCLNAELRLGRYQKMIPEMAALARADDPGRDDQELARLRILAYLRADLASEARRTYREIQDWLATHRGIEPGPELRALHQSLIDQNPLIDSPNGANVTSSGVTSTARDQTTAPHGSATPGDRSDQVESADGQESAGSDTGTNDETDGQGRDGNRPMVQNFNAPIDASNANFGIAIGDRFEIHRD